MSQKLTADLPGADWETQSFMQTCLAGRQGFAKKVAEHELCESLRLLS